ncbi:Hypothetical protein POVN_LOCUS736 [uncultured virus]|nr:Hypothetical protein POVN_LOCUS736 [uncultured virus]
MEYTDYTVGLVPTTRNGSNGHYIVTTNNKHKRCDKHGKWHTERHTKCRQGHQLDLPNVSEIYPSQSDFVWSILNEQTKQVRYFDLGGAELPAAAIAAAVHTATSAVGTALAPAIAAVTPAPPAKIATASTATTDAAAKAEADAEEALVAQRSGYNFWMVLFFIVVLLILGWALYHAMGYWPVMVGAVGTPFAAVPVAIVSTPAVVTTA